MANNGAIVWRLRRSSAESGQASCRVLLFHCDTGLGRPEHRKLPHSHPDPGGPARYPEPDKAGGGRGPLVEGDVAVELVTGVVEQGGPGFAVGGGFDSVLVGTGEDSGAVVEAAVCKEGAGGVGGVVAPEVDIERGFGV